MIALKYINYQSIRRNTICMICCTISHVVIARAEGHAQVTVVAEVDPLFVQSVLQFRPLDFYTTQQSCSSSSSTSSPLKHDREELLRKLFRCGHNMSQMANSANKQVVEAPASYLCDWQRRLRLQSLAPAEEAEVLSSM